MKPSVIFIGVGSNLGDRQAQIQDARGALAARAGIRGLVSSAVRETDPVSRIPQGKFLNAVWRAETTLAPEALMKILLEIETAFGRVREEKNGPRTLDLDLLFFGDRILRTPGIEVPHPRLHERLFVLEPLVELAPEWVHPVLQCTVRTLWEGLRERNTESAKMSG
ncbi:MAG: 2-amino-4-hydroxy-6-hydroxymethyldihydropteridine diphosphokinase [Candidatus Omnitrophota bacterium]